MLTLKSLAIKRLERYEEGYKAGENRIAGKIVLDGASSEISVRLTEKQCRKILVIVSQAARDTADEAAQAMTAEVFNLPTMPQLENEESDIPF